MSTYLPCPKCGAVPHPVIARHRSRMECKGCGFSVCVELPKDIVLSEWEKPFEDAWNVAVREWRGE